MLARIEDLTGYITNIDDIRLKEYPQLQETTYLDHAGATLYAQSLVDSFTTDLKAHLYGNPHSGANSSQRSSDRVQETRRKLLDYCKASPDHFDVVFVANATAAVKLVAEAFRDRSAKFDYAYHRDCHTSLVGVRHVAGSSCCISSEDALEQWLYRGSRLAFRRRRPRLFAFPGQSNLTGFRPSLRMCSQIRRARSLTHDVYCLLDAAALISTSELDLSDAENAPDFTALSTYKIFGYPDLGALIVKKASSAILLEKRYFGGGTVDMVTTDTPWHVKKDIIHEALEEGTLPFHNIVALEHALETHAKLFGSPVNVSRHARYLATSARHRMGRLSHTNGLPVCRIYSRDKENQGPVIAFNLLDTRQRHFRTYVVEHVAINNNIALRVGGMCNPGGIQTALSIPFRHMKHNYDIGTRCGDDSDLPDDFHGAIGMVRVSFGAASALADVDRLIEFVQDNFTDREIFDQVFDGAKKDTAPLASSNTSHGESRDGAMGPEKAAPVIEHVGRHNSSLSTIRHGLLRGFTRCWTRP